MKLWIFVCSQNPVDSSTCESSEVLMYWPTKNSIQEMAVTLSSPNPAKIVANVFSGGNGIILKEIKFEPEFAANFGISNGVALYAETNERESLNIIIEGNHSLSSIKSWEKEGVWQASTRCHGWISPLISNPFQTPTRTWNARSLP